MIVLIVRGSFLLGRLDNQFEGLITAVGELRAEMQQSNQTLAACGKLHPRHQWTHRVSGAARHRLVISTPPLKTLNQLAGIIGALCACYGIMACAPDTLLSDDLAQATANGVVETTVVEITRAYTDNALRAADTYDSGKAIRIIGRIGEIKPVSETDDRIIIVLSGPSGFFDGVESYLFADEHSKAIALNIGDTVTLICAKSEGSGGFEAVTLNGCRIE